MFYPLKVIDIQMIQTTWPFQIYKKIFLVVNKTYCCTFNLVYPLFPLSFNVASLLFNMGKFILEFKFQISLARIHTLMNFLPDVLNFKWHFCFFFFELQVFFLDEKAPLIPDLRHVALHRFANQNLDMLGLLQLRN